MFILTIFLTVIQFGILFFLFFKVKKLDNMLEQQLMENNQLMVSIKKLHEKLDDHS
ncbi:hypothetical protein [Aquibacillus saliphilus]|uniref:hypothetical protein n=1 Tax=Aquibacillus saliphilus TaxID=1909422 RepID=UPI001CF030CD|nr:hypothetical protein [Aquibacillus saliphilus]